MKLVKKKTMQEYSKSFLLRLYEQMTLVRLFEEEAARLYKLRKIGGFCHLYIGQEAVATGCLAALRLGEDYVITAYRDHAHALLLGMSCSEVMAELLGKASGCSKGKGGSMHLFDIKKKMYGGHGIVGSHIPLGAGMAMAIKYKKELGVVLCFFGDGAIHMGTFHETLNMAKIWDLPIVFVCENNQYGMGTHYLRVSSEKDLFKKSSGYNIPGFRVDGMDVLETYENANVAIREARKGNPVFLEIVTYRYKGHSMSDPAKYRSMAELDANKAHDPIQKLAKDLINNKIVDEKVLDEMKKKCMLEVKSGVQFAESAMNPGEEEIFCDIYV